MGGVFADTGYWVAIVHPHDGLHQKAIDVSRQLRGYRIVTSEMVLVEVLNMFSGRGAHLREAASRAVQEITNDVTIEVVPQTRKLFLDALYLYRARADKEWSLTDCASFVIMKRLNIDEALTGDHHFEQYAFKALLK